MSLFYQKHFLIRNEVTCFYTIYVYAYSSTGDSVNVSESITVYVEEAGTIVTWSEEFNIDGSISADNWSYEIGTGCPDLCGSYTYHWS